MAAFWRNFARSNSRRVFSLSRSSFNRSASFSCAATVCPGPRLRTLVRNQLQLLITSQNALVEIINPKWGLNNLTNERTDVSTRRFPLSLLSLCLFPFLFSHPARGFVQVSNASIPPRRFIPYRDTAVACYKVVSIDSGVATLSCFLRPSFITLGK